jgi:hypothetical protein
LKGWIGVVVAVFALACAPAALAAVPRVSPPASATFDEGPAGTRAVSLRVAVAPAPRAPLRVDWRLPTAAKRDFSALRGSVTVARGAKGAAVVLQLRGDRVHEADHRYLLTYSLGKQQARLARRATALRVRDDDPLPVISSVTPRHGGAGMQVVIDGAHFVGATAVAFGGVAASFTLVSDVRIDAFVPDGAVTGPISVRTPAGVGSSVFAFEVVPAPTIVRVDPGSGPPGTVVTITGTNLTGASRVSFGTAIATTFTVVDAEHIQATVPATAATGRISVVTPGGTATSPSDFVVIPIPRLTSFAPASGQSGTEVTITGTNFTGATSVTFNGAAASFTVVSATEIRATVPAGATTGPIVVTTPGGTATSATEFVVPVPPEITSFDPVTGPPGTTVILTGVGFTGTTAVKFEGFQASFTVVDDRHIRTIVPNLTPGNAHLTVTTPLGTATASQTFAITPPPA